MDNDSALDSGKHREGEAEAPGNSPEDPRTTGGADPGKASPEDARPDTEPAGDSVPEKGSADGTDSALGIIAERIGALEERIRRGDERARHRESVIDRLHAENERLKTGERRAILDPAITDLISLYDQLDREARGMRSRGADEKAAALLDSLADDALLALERIGVEPLETEPGDAFSAEHHRPLGAVDHPDPARANTIAEITARGFRDTATGRVRRKAQARFYRTAPAPDGHAPDGAPHP